MKGNTSGTAGFGILRDMRNVEILRQFTKHAAGSVLIKQGDTWVLCTACVEEKVPPFLKGSGKGWVTAEYAMLPSSTLTRKERDIKKLRQDGRGVEIGRLIGRALRASIDLTKLGERTITIDCDVLQADGGTRCASITGGMVALEDAVASLLASGALTENPLLRRVAAISVGICAGVPTVMTSDGRFVELQGTAEHDPFTDEQLDALRALAKEGCAALFKAQAEALGRNA